MLVCLLMVSVMQIDGQLYGDAMGPKPIDDIIGLVG